jgi:hypothetical protein
LRWAPLLLPQWSYCAPRCHMPPGEQADLLTANLPAISDALGKGAIASLSRGRLRLRALPIAVESDNGSGRGRQKVS